MPISGHLPPVIWLLPSLQQVRRSTALCEGPQDSTGPAAGARKTHVLRSRNTSGDELENSLELAAAAATDLTTYWSNSVRPYALRGSPFLRPPVFACLTRLNAEFDAARRTTPGTLEININAQLKASHSRRLLEVELIGRSSGSVILRGSAWCSATTPDAKFSQVVVPPVPLASEETEVALSRFKALEKRPRLPLVSQNGHQSLGTVGCLSLTLEAEDVTADELANVYGRTQKPSSKKLDPNACGDVGPVLGKALQLSTRLAEGSGRKVELCSIEVETSPVAVNSEIRLCACMDKGSDQSPAILVTGWLHGKDVLRFRAVFRPSVE